MHRELVTALIAVKCLEGGQVRLEVEDASTGEITITDLTASEAWFLGMALMRGAKGN